MSLTAFKRKSVINYGSKRSGIAPGGFWLPQGPFGHSTKTLKEAIQNYGAVGFSINGGRRNMGGVGRDMKMSKSGTPYRGTQPIGFGGTFGKYPSATLIGNDEQSTGVIPNAHSKQAAVEPVLNSDGQGMENIQTIGFNQITQETKRLHRVKDYMYKIWQPQIRVVLMSIMLAHMKVNLLVVVQHYVLQEDQLLDLNLMIWFVMLLIQKHYINQFLILNIICILQEVVIILLVLKNLSLLLLPF
jgi:hypothetical protein